MISSYPRSLALAAANSLSVSAPFRCSAANASSSDEIPARSIGPSGAATTTPSIASPGIGAPSLRGVPHVRRVLPRDQARR